MINNNLGWILPVSLLVFLIILVIIISIIKYKKTGRKVMTIQKIALMSLMSALVFVSGRLTFTIPPGISLGVEEAILLYSGFLLGPIEGMIIALIGDGLGTMLMGGIALRHISYWLVAPTATLIGSLIRIIKDKNIQFKELPLIINSIFSLLIIALIIIIIINPSGIKNNGDLLNIYERVFYPFIAILLFTIYQIFYLHIKKKNQVHSNIFMFIFIIAFMEKVIGSWLLGTINSTIIFDQPIGVAFLSKIISTPIVVPFITCITFSLVTKVKIPSSIENQLDNTW